MIRVLRPLRPPTGTLVPGSATFELELKVAGVIVDTKTTPITLVATTPSIVSLDLSVPTIATGGNTPYTVTTYNPTGVTLTRTVFTQGYVEQAGGTSCGGGGTNVQCGSPSPEVPRSACAFSFIAVASNSAAGTGVLAPGAATFRPQLIQNSTVLDEGSSPSR